MHHNAVIISNGLKYHGECVAHTTFIIIVFLKIWCVVIATCIYISRLCILCIYKAILIPKCLRYTITGISIYVYIKHWCISILHDIIVCTHFGNNEQWSNTIILYAYQSLLHYIMLCIVKCTAHQNVLVLGFLLLLTLRSQFSENNIYPWWQVKRKKQ